MGTGVKDDNMMAVDLDADVSGLVQRENAAIKYSQASGLGQAWIRSRRRSSTGKNVRISEGNEGLFDASFDLTGPCTHRTARLGTSGLSINMAGWEPPFVFRSSSYGIGASKRNRENL